MPKMVSTWAAASDSRSALITGMAPAQLASKRSAGTRSAAATSNSSAPCWAMSCLLAVTTCLPACRAPRSNSSAAPTPPISSTTIWISGSSTISPKSCHHQGRIEVRVGEARQLQDLAPGRRPCRWPDGCRRRTPAAACRPRSRPCRTRAALSRRVPRRSLLSSCHSPASDSEHRAADAAGVPRRPTSRARR